MMTSSTPRPPATAIGRRSRARGAVAVAVLAAVFLAGCGSDKSTGPGGIAGKYNIVSVDGPAGFDNSAPFVIYNATVDGTPVRAEIANGFVNLGSDGRYSGNATVNVFVAGVLFGSDDSFGGLGSGGGTYTVNGNTVTFDPDDPSLEKTTATYSGGNTLTLVLTGDDPAGTGTVSVTVVARK